MSLRLSARYAFPFCLLLGLVLIALTRWPLLTGESGAPDGDECVVGLMGLHLLERGEFSLFFWGQQYGLAGFEALSAAACFKLFGVSVTALKVSALLLWTVGWLFAALATRRWLGTRAGCLAALLLVFAPAWAVWSMKARGGYVTGFALTGISWWLLALMHHDKHRQLTKTILLGICIALAYFAQPAWALTLGPFYVLLIWRRRRASDVVGTSLGLVPTAVLLAIVAARQKAIWAPPVFDEPAGLTALTSIPMRVWGHLSGAFYYYERLPAGAVTGVCAALWCAAVVAVIVLFIRPPGRRTARGIIRAAAIALVLLLATNLGVSIKWYAFRYLLPLSGLAVIGLAYVLGEGIRTNRRTAPLAALVIVLFIGGGLFSFRELKNLSYAGSVPTEEVTNTEALDSLVKGLLDNNIHHVYSTEDTLQWTLMFMSHEQIKARWQRRHDRMPGVPTEVDRALLTGEPTALIGRPERMEQLGAYLAQQGYPGLDVYVIHNRYFVMPYPPVAVIQLLGYELSPPPGGTPR